nr:hypothetical protein [uncultured Methanospirillum sp.]
MIRGAYAIFERDIRKFIRSPFFFFMTLIFPLVYLVIFGNAMGGTIVHIPIGVTQDELFKTRHPSLQERLMPSLKLMSGTNLYSFRPPDTLMSRPQK